MNPIEKFRYLGFAQTFRKYRLKAERATKRALRRPPALPAEEMFDGELRGADERSKKSAEEHPGQSDADDRAHRQFPFDRW